MLSRASVFTSLLAAADLLDELSGVAFVGAPDISGAFGLGYGAAALTLFVAPQLLGLLLEPPLYLLADRVPRKALVVGGLWLAGACQIAAGLASSYWAFAVANALSAPANGVGINLAQATLMDARPAERERSMARWAFMGWLGDLGTPLLFAALAHVSLGWREAFLITGSLTVAYAALLVPASFPAAGEAGPEAGSARDALAPALDNRRLLLWLGGVALCGLLDEILVAFAALRLDRLGAAAGSRSLALGAFMCGGLVGLVASERVLRRVEPMRLLAFSAAADLAAYLAWLLASDALASGALLFLVGVFTAPLYPIAQAQAYRAAPGRSGLVNAAAQLFVPFELALPFALGLMADAFGLGAALALLALQPLGLLLMALRRL